MPPKGKGPPAKVAAKKAPAAMLAKMKAQIEAQRKAEEEWQRQQEEEERKQKEEERLAELERKREEEEKKAAREQEKEISKTAKVDGKRTAMLEQLERMRAAGMIVPDLPVPGEKKPKGPAQKPPQKQQPKPAAKGPEKTKHADPLESAPAPEAKKEEPEEVEDWEALLDDEANDGAADEGSKAAADEPKMEAQKTSDSVASAGSKSTTSEKRPDIELRSPICCVLGHVDTGKTSLLDRIRRTNVQGGEAGGITQQIGATFFPKESIETSTAELRAKTGLEMKVPGLLVIDTPGHESFTNLRSRGSNLCDIAVLVVDIMHGLEPQTKESIKLLKQRKCPFIVALNKVDRLYEWQPTQNADIQTALEKQKKHVLSEFDTRVANIITEFAEQGFNAELYYKNKDVRNYVSIVPTSAHTGEGIPDLLMLEIKLVQQFMEGKVSFKDDLQCTVLEVKPVQGFGTTIDIVLVNGVLNYGDKIVICGMNGPIVTTIRALLTPQPMKELRVKGEYVHHKSVRAAMGLKISADGLEDAVPGTPLFVVKPGESTEQAEKDVMKDFNSLLGSVSKNGEGVAVQSSTLGSLEALLSFLEVSKIPVSHVSLGPIHKRHLLNMVAMREKQPKYAVVLAFDVHITKEAQELADKNHIKIFSARIIYHLFDMFTKYVEDYDNIVKERNRPIAVFPVVLKIADKIRAKDPIIIQCKVESGQLHVGTPLIVRGSSPMVAVGKVAGIQKDQKELKLAKVGADVAVKLVSADSNLTFGRQFDENSVLVSHISRKSIDALKESFRAEMHDDDWNLIKKLAPEQGVPIGGKSKKPVATAHQNSSSGTATPATPASPHS